MVSSASAHNCIQVPQCAAASRTTVVFVFTITTCMSSFDTTALYRYSARVFRPCQWLDHFVAYLATLCFVRYFDCATQHSRFLLVSLNRVSSFLVVAVFHLAGRVLGYIVLCVFYSCASGVLHCEVIDTWQWSCVLLHLLVLFQLVRLSLWSDSGFGFGLVFVSCSWFRL